MFDELFMVKWGTFLKRKAKTELEIPNGYKTIQKDPMIRKDPSVSLIIMIMIIMSTMFHT